MRPSLALHLATRGSKSGISLVNFPGGGGDGGRSSSPHSRGSPRSAADRSRKRTAVMPRCRARWRKSGRAGLAGHLDRSRYLTVLDKRGRAGALLDSHWQQNGTGSTITRAPSPDQATRTWPSPGPSSRRPKPSAPRSSTTSSSTGGSPLRCSTLGFFVREIGDANRVTRCELPIRIRRMRWLEPRPMSRAGASHSSSYQGSLLRAPPSSSRRHKMMRSQTDPSCRG